MTAPHGSRIFCIVLLAALTIAVPRAARSQTRSTTGDLIGVAFDQSHGVLPGASVTATNSETNQTRTAQTDEVGRFMLPALPPGVYSVTADLAGFAPQTQREIVLQLGTQVAVEFTLSLSSTSAMVTVVGVTPVVDTQQTAVATVITQQQINSLPMNGRDFMSFSVLSPGVTRDNTPQQGASATSGLTFAGQRARSNNITVDGLDNNDGTVGSVRATFSQEAVREFQVITNSYSAEFGKASGGVVNIVTKSGTNVASGNLFNYFRDAALNARGHFEQFAPGGAAISRPKPPYRQQQFGGTFGGPIKADRTFFFGSFERLDVRTSNFVSIDNTTPISLFGQPLGTAVDILRRAGFPVETGDVPYSITSDQLLLKIDHQISASQQLAVRYNYADGLNENVEPWGGLVAKSRGALLDNKDHMLAASHVSVVSSRTVNELRLQLARRDQRVDSLDPACGGPCLNEDQGGPTLEIPGVASVGRQRFTPQNRLSDRYELLDTLSVLRGRHQWKAGVDLNIVANKNQSIPLHFGGRYLFSALPAIPGVLPAPITGIQALSLGLPAAYIQGYGDSSGPDEPHTSRDLSIFAQDDWRATDDLTLKLGVRYQKQFWAQHAYAVPGVSGSYGFPSDNNNVAPRLAVSWAPFGSRKTALHAAYGVYYDNLITADAGVAGVINGLQNGVRTRVSTFPATMAAWNAPGHRLPESGIFPSLVIAVDPDLKTSYAHHVAVGLEHELPGAIGLSVNFVYARGFNQVGTIDYNPIIDPRTGNRPLDIGGQPGTSASVLQYTSFAETWYRGLTVSATKRFSRHYDFLISYTRSTAEDTSTDFQAAFLPQNSGLGRNAQQPFGLPLGFNPADERGPSLQDQPQRLVMSGLYAGPYDINFSSIVTIASGRPYNVLAGADLNGDGDGGAIPGPDRARTDPAVASTSLGRNSARLPYQATVDVRVNKRIPFQGRRSIEVIAEVFNLFNRTNYTDANSIFGTGAYPSSPSPTFGQFQQAAPPRQGQLAIKLNF